MPNGNNEETVLAVGDNIEVGFDTQHDQSTGVTNISLSISIRAAGQQAVDSSNIEGAAGIKVTHADGRVEEFDGPDSPALFQTNPESGKVEERPLPPDSKVEAVRSARGSWLRS